MVKLVQEPFKTARVSLILIAKMKSRCRSGSIFVRSHYSFRGTAQAGSAVQLGCCEAGKGGQQPLNLQVSIFELSHSAFSQ